ncbi:MAG: hypothetical protein J6Z35_04595 [Lachnospiraceae bacterium]|nr:hypothetical protein [Lachnospiraceae bacterium]
MKKENEKIISILLCLFPFIILFTLTQHFFMDCYLLGWMYDRCYLYLWALAILLPSCGMKRLGFAVSYSAFFSIILGQFFGKNIRFFIMPLAAPEVLAHRLFAPLGRAEFVVWITAFTGLMILYVVFCLVKISKSLNPSEIRAIKNTGLLIRSTD